MPTFPTYDGELPQCLNPLNPRHYGLVLYWVFFRPTALKCYLYQASPEIYKSEGGWKNFVIGIQIPAYYNFVLIAFLSVFIICIPIAYLSYFFNASTGCLGIPKSSAEYKIFDSLSNSLHAHNWLAVINWATKNFFAIAGLTLQGVAFGVAGGMAGGVAFSVAFGVAFGVAVGVAFGVGAIRLPFYLIQSIGLLIPKRVMNSHSIIWDELGVLPLPKATQYLVSKLQQNSTQGLSNLAQTIGNPFQALTVQRAGWIHLEQSTAPIETLYHWATATELDRYAQAPIVTVQWRVHTSSRSMIFAELAGTSLTIRGKVVSDFTAIPRLLTQKLRYKPHHPFDKLSLFFRLYLNEQAITEDSSEELLKSYLSDELINLPYGIEFYKSFSNISDYLQFKTPEEIATAPTHLTWLNPTDTFLRPTVIQALSTLASLSQEVQRSNIVSSAVTKRNAILIANDQLEQLKAYVTDQIHPNYPEQKLLLRIIDQWQTIITREGGELGREKLEKPIENPYVVGPPVTGSLFVGREDILTKLEELWTKPDQLESVVIYGHRRMGKTSILRNLPGRFATTTKIINFNIQTQGNVRTTTELIFNLAQAIHDDLPTHLQTATPEPQITDFDRPETAFKRFLKKLEPHRQNDRFIIAIDEFELIEDGIKNGHFEPSLIGHWRGILTDFHWIIFAFAGLHTLQEMTQDYWNPLFGNVRKIPVSFLTLPAARRLITQPSPDFAIDYNPAAIELIYTLTGGQPYLIQLICQTLVSNFNRQRFEENREIEPLFTEKEVNTIVTNPDFFRDGTAYFRAIWEQAQETHAETQLAILKQLALSPATETELNNLIKPSFIPEAVNLLLTHDVIQLNSENQYQYRVELMRQWVQLRD